MSALRQNTAILFADISGSTMLYDKLGNEQALQLITRTLDILAHEMATHHGTLIKTIGDELMCSFPSAAMAVEAACAMQSAVATHNPGGDQPIYVRIGIHFGEVILENGDMFGNTVNIAARVTSITRARQIMTTQAVVDKLPEMLRNKARALMRTEFRGKQDAFDVFQILWEREDTTRTRVGLSAYRKPTLSRHELMLRYHQHVVTLSESVKSIVLGRHEECDLVVQNNNMASRQHARIEYSFGKFLLTDHSSNGTYIRFSDNQVIQLHRQQIVLHGGGTISLGQPFSEEPTEVIEYLAQ